MTVDELANLDYPNILVNTTSGWVYFVDKLDTDNYNKPMAIVNYKMYVSKRFSNDVPGELYIRDITISLGYLSKDYIILGNDIEIEIQKKMLIISFTRFARD